MYSYDDYRLRKGAEYVARYNIMEDGAGKYNDLPYTSYTFQQGPVWGPRWTTEGALSGAVRGKFGAVWDLIYSHYANVLNQGDKVKSIEEKMIQDRWRSTGVPTTNIHADTYDQPGVGALTFLTESGTCILPWRNMDITPVSINLLPHYGSAQITTEGSDSTIVVNGSGTGITGNADWGQLVFQWLIDDGEIVAKIMDINGADNCQAGIMIREKLNEGAKNVFLSLSPVNGVSLTARTTDNDTTTLVESNRINTVPNWLKLVRSKNVFTAYISRDKSDWIEAGSLEVAMDSYVAAGLAVSSGNKDEVCSASFKGVELIQGNIKPVVKLSSLNREVIRYIAPANVDLSGNVYDVDGSISKVEVLVNNEVVTQVEAEEVPSYVLGDLVEGDYEISIRAYDDLGAETSIEPIHVKVGPKTDLLPWYKFDQVGGIMALDESGNSRNAILNGNSAFVNGVQGMRLVLMVI